MSKSQLFLKALSSVSELSESEHANNILDIACELYLSGASACLIGQAVKLYLVHGNIEGLVNSLDNSNTPGWSSFRDSFIRALK